MNDYQLYIDGDFCEASDGGRFDSTNPATGEVWASAPAATEADVDRAVRAAHRAMTSGEWASMTATARGRLLYRLADLVAENAHRLGEVETTDSGKLAAETRAQSAYVADYYRYYAGLADKIQGDTLPIDKPDLHVFTTRDPIGVVAAIVPWNAELFLTATKVGPALAAGNAVVIKASEIAPAPLLEFARVLDEVGFPPGVVNLLSGFGEPCGRALTSHPMVGKVAFTGGVDSPPHRGQHRRQPGTGLARAGWQVTDPDLRRCRPGWCRERRRGRELRRHHRFDPGRGDLFPGPWRHRHHLRSLYDPGQAR